MQEKKAHNERQPLTITQKKERKETSLITYEMCVFV